MSRGNGLPSALVSRLRDVRSCGVITGGGLSAEAGLRPYLGPGGLYDDPRHSEPIIDDLRQTTFNFDPPRTWRVVRDLARQAAAAEPSGAHHALVALEQTLDQFALLTQNLDGLHQRAGSQNVIEIHGNLADTRCDACGARPTLDVASLDDDELPPACERCGGELRPDVVLLGEPVSMERLEPLLGEFYLAPPDLLVVIGTSGHYGYIAEPILFAQQAGRLTVEINVEPTDLSESVGHSLRGTAGDLLPILATALGALPEQRLGPRPIRRFEPRLRRSSI